VDLGPVSALAAIPDARVFEAACATSFRSVQDAPDSVSRGIWGRAVSHFGARGTSNKHLARKMLFASRVFLRLCCGEDWTGVCSDSQPRMLAGLADSDRLFESATDFPDLALISAADRSAMRRTRPAIHPALPAANTTSAVCDSVAKGCDPRPLSAGSDRIHYLFKGLSCPPDRPDARFSNSEDDTVPHARMPSFSAACPRVCALPIY
jgi:hypothetical protein